MTTSRLRYVPFTTAFHDRVDSTVSDMLKVDSLLPGYCFVSTMKLADVGLPPDDIDEHRRALLGIDFGTLFAFQAFLVVLSGLAVANVFISSPAVWYYYGPAPRGQWLWVSGGAALVFVATVLTACGPIYQFNQAKLTSWLLGVAWPLIVAFAAAWVGTEMGPWNHPHGVVAVPVRSSALILGGAVGLLTAAGSLLLLAAMITMALSFDMFTWRLGARRHPDSVIITQLLELRNSLMQSPRKNLQHSREVMRRIEIIAARVEYDLPRILHGGDTGTNARIQRFAQERAAAIRVMKQKVAFADAEGRERVCAELSRLIEIVSAGFWGELPGADPERLTRRRLAVVIGGVFRTVAVAAFPLVLAFSFRQFTGAEGLLWDYLSWGAVIWSIITLLTSFDPLLGTKVTTLKELVSLKPSQDG